MPKQLVEGTDSLDTIWDELVYTYARLRYDADAKDLADQLVPLITRTEDTWKGQRAVWRGEVEAQAFMDSVNYRTDVRTEDLSLVLEVANRRHPQGEQRKERYFPIPKSKMIGLALEAQMPYMEELSNGLPKEPEVELNNFGKGFAQDVTDGKNAIDARNKAAAARREHRVKEISTLVTDANAAREQIYGELLKRRAAKNRDKDWPDSFFRKQRRNTPSERKLEQKRVAVLAALSAKELELTDNAKRKIQREEDPAQLLKWLSVITTATKIEDIFPEE